MKKSSARPQRSIDAPISFKGYRFPPDIISYAVWLYYRFLLSLVEEMLSARGIELTYETVRCWAMKFGLAIAGRIRAMRSSSPGRDEKWHLDEVVVTIHGKKHWLWRAVDEHGALLEVLVQSRRDAAAAHIVLRSTDYPASLLYVVSRQGHGSCASCSSATVVRA